jgi:adenylate cyclase
VELDPSNARGHFELGLISNLRKEFDEGEVRLRKAMALEPEGSDTLGSVAIGLVQLGQHSEAARVADQAMALAPHHNPAIDHFKGLALFHLERFSEALACFAVARSSGYNVNILIAYMAATRSAMGQDELARAEVAKLLELEPNFRLDTWTSYTVLRLSKDRDRLKQYLVQAGVPA